MVGGAIALGVPTPIIIFGLRILAGKTGCDNIVNWNLVNRNDLTTLQNLLLSSRMELELEMVFRNSDRSTKLGLPGDIAI